jgi:hypothetical protein
VRGTGPQPPCAGWGPIGVGRPVDPAGGYVGRDDGEEAHGELQAAEAGPYLSTGPPAGISTGGRWLCCRLQEGWGLRLADLGRVGDRSAARSCASCSLKPIVRLLALPRAPFCDDLLVFASPALSVRTCNPPQRRRCVVGWRRLTKLLPFVTPDFTRKTECISYVRQDHLHTHD